jgi:hypothetical protein
VPSCGGVAHDVVSAEHWFSMPHRLVTLYQHLYDAIHARSGQANPLKLIHVRTPHETCLGWVRWQYLRPCRH